MQEAINFQQMMGQMAPKKPWEERNLWSTTKIVVKSKTSAVGKWGRPVVYYGFIPFVIYLGMTTEPKPALKSLLLSMVLIDG